MKRVILYGVTNDFYKYGMTHVKLSGQTLSGSVDVVNVKFA